MSEDDVYDVLYSTTAAEWSAMSVFGGKPVHADGSPVSADTQYSDGTLHAVGHRTYGLMLDGEKVLLDDTSGTPFMFKMGE